MTKIDLASFKNLYIKTANEYLAAIRRDILKLEKDNKNVSVRKELYRSAHSLASQSLVMHYEETGNLGRQIEFILKIHIDHDRTIHADAFVLIKEAVEQMSLSVASIKKHDKELNLSSETKKLTALTK